jgi:hypothetical protein
MPAKNASISAAETRPETVSGFISQIVISTDIAVALFAVTVGANESATCPGSLGRTNRGEGGCVIGKVRGHRGEKKEAWNTFYKPFANSPARKAESRTC